MFGNDKWFEVSIPPQWKDIVDPYNPNNLTPVGYDFTVDTLETMWGLPKIGVDGKVLPEYRPVPPYTHLEHETWYLRDNEPYVVTFKEQVTIPQGYAGFMWPRSTLTRSGVDLMTAVWDAGYSGVSKTVLINHNQWQVCLERGARIGHMVLIRMDMLTTMYAGQYQHEGIR